jgi:transposase-like protein
LALTSYDIIVGVKTIDESRLNREDFWSRVEVSGPHECWEWKFRYLNRRRGRSKRAFYRVSKDIFPASRVMFLVDRGFIDDSLLVLHSCDNGSCVNPAHLHQGTYQQNAIEATDRHRGIGRGPCAKRVPREKILELLKNGEGLSKIARELGCGYSSVRRWARNYGFLPQMSTRVRSMIPSETFKAALVSEGSVTKAAKKLGISRQAVSERMQRMGGTEAIGF